jgi:hypothetical protein
LYRFPVTASIPKYEPSVKAPVVAWSGMDPVVPVPTWVATPVDGVIWNNWFDAVYA